MPDIEIYDPSARSSIRTQMLPEAEALQKIAQGWARVPGGGNADVDAKILALINGAPPDADTLGEIVLRFAPANGSDDWLKAWASNPDTLIRNTAITRDANSAATAAGVVWPDGSTGAFTGTPSSTFPGAVDAYTVTYVPASGGTTKTVTQPAVTRNASGAVTQRPAMTVS